MTSPQKKVVIRKSTENREEPIPSSSEQIYGDYKVNRTPEESAQESLVASGALQGLKYGSVGKKLTPLTPEDKDKAKRSLGTIPKEDINYYVTEKLGYKGGVASDSALQLIDKLSEIADEKKATEPGQIRELFQGAGKNVFLKQAGITEDQLKELGGKGDKEKMENLYYSILQRTNDKRKNLDPLKITRSSFIVDKLEDIKTPESEKIVVENKPDSAFKQVKDSKGAVRMVKKG